MSPHDRNPNMRAAVGNFVASVLNTPPCMRVEIACCEAEIVLLHVYAATVGHACAIGAGRSRR